MVKKSKLLAALDAHKGRDYAAEKEKKQRKEAEKKKRLKDKKVDDEEDDTVVEANGAAPVLQEESEGWESDESDAAELNAVDASQFIDESDSESSLGGEDPKNVEHDQMELAEDDESDAEEDIPISDIESLASSEKADLLPHQRLTINNTTALKKAYDSISLPYSTLPFSAHQSLTTSDPVSISDINDDLNRELEFCKQCLSAANEGRSALSKEGIPFSRPSDYFAEMVKSDEHMGKIKQKMTDEAASKKAASDARRQRDLKKFGKQVQVAKMQERDKAKRDMLEKVDILKRKRKNADTGTTNEEDMFDVALEDAAKSDRRSKSSRKDGGDRDSRQGKRQKKDQKFGFGGKKRFSKSNDATSTSDMSGFSAKKMKGQKQRPGKARRANMARS